MLLKWIKNHPWATVLITGIIVLSFSGWLDSCKNKGKVKELEKQYAAQCEATKINNQLREQEKRTLIKENIALQVKINKQNIVIADQKEEIEVIYTELQAARRIKPDTKKEKILIERLDKCMEGFSLARLTIGRLEKNNFSLTKQYNNQIKLTQLCKTSLEDEKRLHFLAQTINKELKKQIRVQRIQNTVYKVVFIAALGIVLYQVIVK